MVELEGKGKKEFVFKFVIIGDSGVGKTSLLHYFVYSKCKKKNYYILYFK